MTHIGAFTVTDRTTKKKLAFAVTEGQSTEVDRGRKYDAVLKLQRRGNNLIMGTGMGRHIDDVIANIPDEQRSPQQVSENILTYGKGIPHGKDDGLKFILVGSDGPEPVIYHIDAFGSGRMAPGYMKVDGAFDGSGSRESMPMVERDAEMGLTSTLTDRVEGLFYAFQLGIKAHRDLGVSDKLQLGVVGEDKIRLLYHPSVEPRDPKDIDRYVKTNFGVVPPRVVDEEGRIDWERRTVSNGTFQTMDNMYEAMNFWCLRMNGADVNANTRAGMAKADGAQRERYMADFTKLLDTRDEAKLGLSEFMDVWLRGDLRATIEYLDGFDRTKADRRRHALDALPPAVVANP